MYAVFNVISTGSDLNAGSTTAGSALVTDVGGTYAQGAGAGGTDRYTASAGTPFSATVVGEYVSVYTAAAAATTFVGQITAVNASGASVDISLTIIYGTRPANASTKTAKTGGAWASFATPIAIGGTIPQSTEIDVKAGAALGGAAAVTCAMAGTTSTKPLLIRGYNTTVGDLDLVSATLGYPTATFTSTGRITFSGAAVELRGLSFTAAVNAAVVTLSGAGSLLHNCVVSNTTNNTSARAVQYSGVGGNISCSYLSVVGNCDAVLGASGVPLTLYGCWLVGNSTGASQNGLNTGGTGAMEAVHRCTFVNLGGCGILKSSTSAARFTDNTFNTCGGDAIKFSSVNTSDGCLVADNYFYKSGGYDVNNASGTTMDVFRAINNVHNQPTSGQINGFGDYTEINPITDAGNPFVSSTDLHLISASTGAGTGLPGIWAQASFASPALASTPDVGAWQRAVTAGGGPVGQITGARSIGTY